ILHFYSRTLCHFDQLQDKRLPNIVFYKEEEKLSIFLHSFKKPFVTFLIIEFPHSFWSRHDIQIITFITRKTSHWMISFRNQDHIAIFYRHRFVQAPIIIVYSLKCKSLAWVNFMVIRFLQI